MKIQPITGAGQVTTPPSVDKTAAAIAAFNKASQQSAPPVNQNAVPVEELGAVMQTSSEAAAESNEAERAELETREEVPQPKSAADTKLEQLARQERALRAKARQQEQAIKARERALTEREAKLNQPQPEPKIDASKYLSVDAVKQNAINALLEAGVPLDQVYEQLTQQLLNPVQQDPRVNATINRLEAKIKALEEANDTSKQTYQEQQTAQYQAAVKQIEMDAKALVRNNPEFEAIKAIGAVKDVVELITETYNKDGILLTVEEAAQEVESYLVDEAMKVTRIEKIKKKLNLGNANQSSTQKQTPIKPKQPQTMKTLTNTTSSTRQLSARERALLAFKGELKP